MQRLDELTLSPRDSLYEDAHHAVFDPRVALLGHVAYVIVLSVIWLIYRPLAPPDAMLVWCIITGAVIALIAAFDIAFAIRRPAQDELMRVWRRLDKCVPFALDLTAVATLFLLFPHATDGVRGLTIAYFVGYVPLQMISDPENVVGNQLSIVVVLGAFAVSLIIQGDPSNIALAGLVTLYGAVLFISSGVLRRGVIAAQADRMASDRAAQGWRETVATLHAERMAKTKFIAAATHDLGQPLMAARLFNDQAVNATTAAQRASAADGATRAFAAADSLLSHMLHAMRLQADAVLPHMTDVKLHVLLTNLHDQYSPLAQAAGAQLRVVNSSLVLRSDPSLLERLVANLLQNAITHAGAQRILLGVRRKPEGWLQFWVVDDGCGIPACDETRLFDDYFRSSGSAFKPGFGLGLASVKRLASLLGGRVRYVARNRGAAFCVDLPLHPAL